MPGNVNINIPPRLIESARAAQYANREALDGRALVGKIKAKAMAKAQRAAAVQARPPLTAPVGGPLEESRKPDTWRIWRKRRVREAVNVGVGWLHIAQNYTVISNDRTFVDSGWSNGSTQGGPFWPFYSFSDGNPGIWDGVNTMRTQSTDYSANASLELVVTVGTRSGETWRRARHTISFNGLSNSFRQDDWTVIEGIGLSEKVFVRTTQTDNFDVRLWYGLFPAGGTSVILAVSIIQFNHAYSADGSISPLPPESVTVQNTKQISFLITESEITEVTHPLPVYVQKDIDAYLAQAFTASVPGYDVTVNPARTASVIPSSIGMYQQRGWWTTSAMFEGITQNGAFSSVSAQQAKSSYATFSGKAEIPVLRYKPNDPLAAGTPTTEEGYFGIIPGASVTSSVTSAMLAAELEDTTEQSPGLNAANQPEPVQFIVAYDYHGGSYCRDQLKRIGITL